MRAGAARDGRGRGDGAQLRFRHVAVSAGTGTGKSLAYLVPAAIPASWSSSRPRPRPCRISLRTRTSRSWHGVSVGPSDGPCSRGGRTTSAASVFMSSTDLGEQQRFDAPDASPSADGRGRPSGTSGRQGAARARLGAAARRRDSAAREVGRVDHERRSRRARLRALAVLRGRA